MNSPSEVPRPFAPVAPADRLANLDFARGMALLGIFLVNVAHFFAPLGAAIEPESDPSLTPVDRLTATLIHIFCQSKFVSLFSLLFGYGLAGQIETAAARGESAVRFTVRRLLALLLFGVIHAVVLWHGDILVIYALIGGWLLLARYLSLRALVWTALGLLGMAFLLRIGTEWLGTLGFMTANAPLVEGASYRGWEAILKAQGNPASPIWREAEVVAFRDGPWAHALLFRVIIWVYFFFSLPFGAGWLILGMFFLGAALWRVRFFAPEQARLRWKLALICLPIGVAIEVLAWWFFHGSSNGATRRAIGGMIQQTALFFLPLGYLSMFALIGDALPAWLRGPVCSAGRMSLSVYLTETLVTTCVAYHWGFRYFGSVAPHLQALFAIGVWLVLILLARLWLTFFRQGPMEWLWRRLAYGSPKRQNPEPAAV